MNYVRIYDDEEKTKEDQIINQKLKQYDLIKLDFLTTEQIFGNETAAQLEIFEKYGTKASITDFSVVLGGFIGNGYFTDEGISLNNRPGNWWIKDPLNNNTQKVQHSGSVFWLGVDYRDGGCRPSLPYSSISSISSNKVRYRNGVLEVEFGEYPQWICSKEISEVLENLYSNNNLNTTGKVYITDSRRYNSYDKDFEPQEHIEYEYNGKKYVRVKVNSCYDGHRITFSNGEKYKDGDFVWIEVSPIKWLVDEKTDIALTKNIIVAGIQFNKDNNYTGDNFDEMNIKKFMDNYLSKEIIPDVINYQINNEIKEETVEEKLEKERKTKLKEYGLDKESIKNFRSGIKKISESECEELTGELFREIVYHDINGNASKISNLILSGADFKAKRYWDNQYHPLLYWSIKCSDLYSIILLIKAGANFNSSIYIEQSIYYDRPALLEILILLGVNCNSMKIHGLKPIDYAKNYKRKECIKILEMYTQEEIDPASELLEIVKKPKEKTEKEILEDGIKEMGEVLEECSDLINNSYQKKLKK